MYIILLGQIFIMKIAMDKFILNLHVKDIVL
jgi:hypothetical protein